MMLSMTKRRRYPKKRFRSGLEVRNSDLLEDLGVSYEYETLKIKYIPKVKTYIPDFVLPNGIIIETKGRFTTSDRSKHLRVKEAHPDLDIRFVFSNPNSKLYKGAKTTYADWCDKYGFQYAKEYILLDWIKE